MSAGFCDLCGQIIILGQERKCSTPGTYIHAYAGIYAVRSSNVYCIYTYIHKYVHRYAGMLLDYQVFTVYLYVRMYIVNATHITSLCFQVPLQWDYLSH